MIETVFMAFVVAKLKGINIRKAIYNWPMYPLFLVEFIYVILQFQIFKGRYNYIRYTRAFKILLVAALMLLILRYRLYLQASIGAAVSFIGNFLNNLAMSSNQGKMPVFPCLSYMTGYINKRSFFHTNDIHVLGNEATKLKIFTDIFDIGYCVMSIGDILIRVMVFIIVYYSLKNMMILEVHH